MLTNTTRQLIDPISDAVTQLVLIASQAQCNHTPIPDLRDVAPPVATQINELANIGLTLMNADAAKIESGGIVDIHDLEEAMKAACAAATVSSKLLVDACEKLGQDPYSQTGTQELVEATKGILEGTRSILDTYDDSEVAKILAYGKHLLKLLETVGKPETYAQQQDVIGGLQKIRRAVTVFAQLVKTRGPELLYPSLQTKLQTCLDGIMAHTLLLMCAAKLVLTATASAHTQAMDTVKWHADNMRASCEEIMRIVVIRFVDESGSVNTVTLSTVQSDGTAASLRSHMEELMLLLGSDDVEAAQNALQQASQSSGHLKAAQAMHQRQMLSPDGEATLDEYTATQQALSDALAEYQRVPTASKFLEIEQLAASMGELSDLLKLQTQGRLLAMASGAIRELRDHTQQDTVFGKAYTQATHARSDYDARPMAETEKRLHDALALINSPALDRDGLRSAGQQLTRALQLVSVMSPAQDAVSAQSSKQYLDNITPVWEDKVRAAEAELFAKTFTLTQQVEAAELAIQALASSLYSSDGAQVTAIKHEAHHIAERVAATLQQEADNCEDAEQREKYQALAQKLNQALYVLESSDSGPKLKEATEELANASQLEGMVETLRKIESALLDKTPDEVNIQLRTLENQESAIIRHSQAAERRIAVIRAADKVYCGAVQKVMRSELPVQVADVQNAEGALVAQLVALETGSRSMLTAAMLLLLYQLSNHRAPATALHTLFDAAVHHAAVDSSSFQTCIAQLVELARTNTSAAIQSSTGRIQLSRDALILAVSAHVSVQESPDASAALKKDRLKALHHATAVWETLMDEVEQLVISSCRRPQDLVEAAQVVMQLGTEPAYGEAGSAEAVDKLMGALGNSISQGATAIAHENKLLAEQLLHAVQQQCMACFILAIKSRLTSWTVQSHHQAGEGTAALESLMASLAWAVQDAGQEKTRYSLTKPRLAFEQAIDTIHSSVQAGDLAAAPAQIENFKTDASFETYAQDAVKACRSAHPSEAARLEALFVGLEQRKSKFTDCASRHLLSSSRGGQGELDTATSRLKAAAVELGDGCQGGLLATLCDVAYEMHDHTLSGTILAKGLRQDNSAAQEAAAAVAQLEKIAALLGCQDAVHAQLHNDGAALAAALQHNPSEQLTLAVQVLEKDVRQLERNDSRLKLDKAQFSAAKAARLSHTATDRLAKALLSSNEHSAIAKELQTTAHRLGKLNEAARQSDLPAKLQSELQKLINDAATAVQALHDERKPSIPSTPVDQPRISSEFDTAQAYVDSALTSLRDGDHAKLALLLDKIGASNAAEFAQSVCSSPLIKLTDDDKQLLAALQDDVTEARAEAEQAVRAYLKSKSPTDKQKAESSLIALQDATNALETVTNQHLIAALVAARENESVQSKQDLAQLLALVGVDALEIAKSQANALDAHKLIAQVLAGCQQSIKRLDEDDNAGQMGDQDKVIALGQAIATASQLQEALRVGNMSEAQRLISPLEQLCQSELAQSKDEKLSREIGEALAALSSELQAASTTDDQAHAGLASQHARNIVGSLAALESRRKGQAVADLLRLLSDLKDHTVADTTLYKLHKSATTTKASPPPSATADVEQFVAQSKKLVSVLRTGRLRGPSKPKRIQRAGAKVAEKAAAKSAAPATVKSLTSSLILWEALMRDLDNSLLNDGSLRAGDIVETLRAVSAASTVHNAGQTRDAVEKLLQALDKAVGKGHTDPRVARVLDALRQHVLKGSDDAQGLQHLVEALSAAHTVQAQRGSAAPSTHSQHREQLNAIISACNEQGEPRLDPKAVDVLIKDDALETAAKDASALYAETTGANGPAADKLLTAYLAQKSAFADAARQHESDQSPESKATLVESAKQLRQLSDALQAQTDGTVLAATFEAVHTGRFRAKSDASTVKQTAEQLARAVRMSGYPEPAAEYVLHVGKYASDMFAHQQDTPEYATALWNAVLSDVERDVSERKRDIGAVIQAAKLSLQPQKGADQEQQVRQAIEQMRAALAVVGVKEPHHNRLLLALQVADRSEQVKKVAGQLCAAIEAFQGESWSQVGGLTGEGEQWSKTSSSFDHLRSYLQAANLFIQERDASKLTTLVQLIEECAVAELAQQTCTHLAQVNSDSPERSALLRTSEEVLQQLSGEYNTNKLAAVDALQLVVISSGKDDGANAEAQRLLKTLEMSATALEVHCNNQIVQALAALEVAAQVAKPTTLGVQLRAVNNAMQLNGVRSHLDRFCGSSKLHTQASELSKYLRVVVDASNSGLNRSSPHYEEVKGAHDKKAAVDAQAATDVVLAEGEQPTLLPAEEARENPLKAAAQELKVEVSRWAAEENPVVFAASTISQKLAELAEHYRQIRPDSKITIINATKEIVVLTKSLCDYAVDIANRCTDLSLRKNLLRSTERLPTLSQQLKILVAVKASAARDVDQERQLIVCVQNLMAAVKDVLNGCESASIRINFAAAVATGRAIIKFRKLLYKKQTEAKTQPKARPPSAGQQRKVVFDMKRPLLSTPSASADTRAARSPTTKKAQV
ncbi:hypothetical protein RI367_001144 [Sorochytrium milnesiophthora]